MSISVARVFRQAIFASIFRITYKLWYNRTMTTTRVLDRRVQFDEKSRNFPITAVVNTSEYKTTNWECNTYNDQGSEGACVGFGWGHELAAVPAPVPTDYAKSLAIYKRAQQLDQWEGEAYSGTSVLGGAKAVAELRNNVGEPYLKEYRWAFGLQDLILALSHQGPVVLGLNWYSGMFNTDAQGYLRVTGELSGGHCLLAVGVNIVLAAGFTGTPTRLEHIDLDRSFVVLHNSWGQDWGVSGRCRMTLRDMQRLLSEQGEACVPVVRTTDATAVIPTDPIEPAPVKPKGRKRFFTVSRSSVFHSSHPGLREAKVFESYEEARKTGLRPCAVCKPTP
jgi:hypothetical protein